MIGRRTCFRENDDLVLWRGPAVKKKPSFFTTRAISPEILRSTASTKKSSVFQI